MEKLRLTIAASPALAFALLISQAVGSAELREHVEALFSIGQTKDIDVTVPGWGFVGGPPWSSAPPNMDFATKDEDFVTRRLRITVVDLFDTKHGLRVVLELDEPSPAPGYTNEGPLFKAYVDVTPDGARVYGVDRIIGLVGKDVELSECAFAEGAGIRNDLPFPLPLTTIPALSSDPSMRECGGVFGGDLAVSYELPAEGAGASSGTTLKAVLLSTVPARAGAFDLPGVRVKYFDPDTKTISDTPAENRVKASLLAEEIQRWGDKPDWLWQEMERFDKDGHLTMRCKVVNPK